jgi:hypothetical protein
MSEDALDPILGELLEMTLDNDQLDFETAKDRARELARQVHRNAMLLSWHDRRTDAFGPPVRCGADRRSPWVVWAASRGADLTVRVNGGIYVFYFLKSFRPEEPRL